MEVKFVKKVGAEKDMWKMVINVLQTMLPESKHLTTKELDVYAHVLSKDLIDKQFRQPQRDKNAKELGLNETAFAMHRSRIAKKGWIIDKRPDKYVSKLHKEVKSDKPREVNINIKLLIDD